MKKMRNRIVSGILALTMVASLLPAGILTPSAHAAGALTAITSASIDSNGHYIVKVQANGTMPGVGTAWTQAFIGVALDGAPGLTYSSVSTRIMVDKDIVSPTPFDFKTAVTDVSQNKLLSGMYDITAAGIAPSAVDGKIYTFEGDLNLTESGIKTALSGKTYYKDGTLINNNGPYPIAFYFYYSGDSLGASADMTEAAEKKPANLIADPKKITSTNGTTLVTNEDGSGTRGNLETGKIIVDPSYPWQYSGTLKTQGVTLTVNDGRYNLRDHEDDYVEFALNIPAGKEPAVSNIPLSGTVRIPYYDGLGTEPGNVKYCEIEVDIPVPGDVTGTMIEITVTVGGAAVDGTTTLKNSFGAQVELLKPNDVDDFIMAETPTYAGDIVTGPSTNGLPDLTVIVPEEIFSGLDNDGYCDGTGHTIAGKGGTRKETITVSAPAGTTPGDYTGFVNYGWGESGPDGAEGKVASVYVLVHVVGNTGPVAGTWTIKGAVTPSGSATIDLDGNGTSTTVTTEDGALKPANQTVAVTATPTSGWHFSSFTATNASGLSGESVDSTTGVATVTYAPTADNDTVTATFEANTATVTLKKDGVAMGANVPVQLRKTDGTTVVASGTTDASGVATFTTGSGSVTLAAGTYKVYVPKTAVDTSADTDSNQTVTIAADTGTGSATVDYYTVTAAVGSNAATATVDTTTSVVVVAGTKVALAATAASGYTGNATWTFSKPTTNAGTIPSSTASGNSYTYTVNGSTIATASYGTLDTYTATVTLWENASGSSNSKVAATAVAVGNLADGSDGTAMSSSTTGVWTKGNVPSNTSYQYVTITVDGATYTVDLTNGGKITYNTRESVDVILYQLTLEVDTTVNGSAAPYGAATVTAGGHDFTATSTTSDRKGTVTFHAPGSATVTLKEAVPKVDKTLTPAVNYTDSAAGNANWTVSGHNGVDTDAETFTPAATTTITATFTPHGILSFNKAITVDVEVGYSDTVILEASGASTPDTDKGYVENIGPGSASGLTYTFADTASTTGGAAKLAMVDKPTALDEAGGTKPWAPASIKLTNGLAKGTYKVNLTVASSDTDALTDTVLITINVLPAASATATPNALTWDTYTETIHSAHTASVWDTTIKLKNLASIEGVSYGALDLIENTDYIISNKTPADVNGSSTGEKTLPLQLTKAGLKKLTTNLLPGTKGIITVTVKDTAGAVKTASITMSLEDTMPALASATFKNGIGVTTDSSSKIKYWAKDSAGIPDLEILTNTTESKNNTTLDTGAVTYKWYKNGALQTAWTGSNLTAAQWSGLAIGDVIRVEATGQGAAWSVKPSGAHAYEDDVTVSDTIKVGMPTVTVKISVDGGAQQNSPYQSITAAVNVLGANTLLTTTNPDAKKYVFVNWNLDTSGGGTFGISSPTTNDQTDPTVIFTPAKAATVVANYKTIATLAYTKGATASGPNTTGGSNYTDTLTNVGAKPADITSVAIDSTSAANFSIVDTPARGALAANGTSGAFTITPKTGNDAPSAGVHAITVTTTYTYKDGGTNTNITPAATVVQTVYYTVPEPTYNVTLAATAGGTNRGNYKGTNYDVTSTTTTGNVIAVTKNHSVALTALPAAGYKFVNWTLANTAGSTSDKLANAATDASNAYGGVTAAQTITANFKAVTDLSETHTKTSDSVEVNYSATTVYAGKVTNAGALAATATYTLSDVKKDGATASAADAAKFTVSYGSGTIAAASAPGTTNTDQAGAVNVAAGLGVGTYTMKLTIQETTAAANTMNGQFKKEIDLVFIVGAKGVAKVQVKLNGTNKNAERVDLKPASGVVVSTAISGNDYTATTAVVGTTYNILVNGVDTGVTVAAVAATATATPVVVNLYTLTTSVAQSGTPATDDGSVSATGGVKIAVTGGTTGGDYVEGSSVTISAVPNTGKHFTQWTDERSTKNLWTSNGNKSTTNPETITMNADHAVKAHFADNEVKDTYYTVTYKDGTNTLATFTVKDQTNHTIMADPYKSGYVFLYWTNADAADTKQYKKGGTNGSITVSKDVVLNANWVAEPTWPTLRDGVYGESYTSAALAPSGYTVTVAAKTSPASGNYGGLPTGLALATTGANAGKITGTPAETGNYEITMTLSKDGVSWTRDYTIFIDKATPALSGISFSNAANGVNTDALKISGTVKAPLYKPAAWTAPKSYTYSDYVFGTSATPAEGSLKVTEYEGADTTSITQINFGTDTSKSGKVTFTPSSTTATGATVTHQIAQKYDDIYKTVEAPCTFNMGGKTYGIEVTPDAIPGGSYTNEDINIGGTLPTTTAWSFAVENKGNQVAHVTYTLQGTDAGSFVLTEGYTHKFQSGDTAKNNDQIAVGASDGAFTVGVASSVSTTTPGVYVAQVKVENWSVKADGSKGDLQDTVIVPIRFEVKDTPFTGTVQIDLNKVGGTKDQKQQVPNSGTVSFKAVDGSVVAGTWDSTDKIYKASLLSSKTYTVLVNGVPSDQTVSSSSKSATVDMYELALAQDATSAAVDDITSSQTGEGYYLKDQKVTISTPSSFGSSPSKYDFVKWVNGGTTVATTNAYTYTMPQAATTLTANYEKRSADTVAIKYHSNYGTDTVLWEQQVAKGSTSVTLSSTVPTRNGYVFDHWDEAATDTGTNADPNHAPGATVAIAGGLNADLDLYAQWVEVVPSAAMSLSGETKYGARYSASVAAGGWVKKGTSTAANAPAVKYQLASGALPGGLKLDENTGVISGRPYEVSEGASNASTGFTFTVKVVTDDAAAATLYTSGSLSIKVNKAQPYLSNVQGKNATAGADFTKADYTADVVADILKTKGVTDGKPDASKDVWDDAKTIISGGSSGLHYTGSGSSATYTAKNDGGELMPPASGSFSAGSNSVKLTWTPGDTKAALDDAAGNDWGDIYNPAEATINVTTTGDTWKLTVAPTVIKFKVVKGTTAYQVLDNTTYTAIGSSTADDIVLTNAGNMPLYAVWALDGADKAKFSGPATPSSRQNLTATGATQTHTITAVPNYNAAVGTYTAQVKVDYYKASTGGTALGSEYVTLVLEVVEPDTFSFDVHTYLNSFAADASSSSATAGAVAKGDAVSVVLVNAANSSDTKSPTSHTSNSGEYTFTLKTADTYKVLVNGVELPGVRINKTTASPQRVDLYQLALGKDANGSANPTAAAASPSTSSGYYLPGERITVTEGGAASGYQFKSWTETVEGGSVVDTTNENYSTANPLYYVMGKNAVQLLANYGEVGKQFKVVLNANNGTLTYSDNDFRTVLTGGKNSGSDYKVDDGATFGLGMSIAGTPAAGAKEYKAVQNGYTFLGWSTSATAASGKYSFVATATLAAGDGDGDNDTITLYAVWSKDNDLKLAPKTITGTYKHAITAVSPSVSGGSGTYNGGYASASDAFPIYTLAMDATTGVVSGTPDDVGTKTSTVTVTDSAGNKASALYTVVIEKANVVPSAAKPLPTQVTVTNGGNVAAAITTALGGTQMDGDDTNETGINGTWSIETSPVPSTPGTHSVVVKFTPANKSGAPDTHAKDGDHYNTYTATIPVVIDGRRITNADLDTTATMKPAVGSALVGIVPTTNRTLTPTDATYATGKAATTGDVYIADVQWTKDGVALTDPLPVAEGGADYALYVTLGITDKTTWRFDPNEFDNSHIAGIKAEKIAANDTMVVLRVTFPKRITVIDVATNTPIHNTDSNSVWVPDSHAKEYEITGHKWYEAGTSTEVNATAKFDKTKFYDLVVTVTPRANMEFSDEIKNLIVGASMNDCDGDAADGDTATVNGKMPPVESDLGTDKRIVKVETAYSEAGGITIRYRAFQPADQKLVGIRVEGTPGVYYAQTGNNKNHFDTLNTGAAPADATGNTGSKDKFTFTFNFGGLKVVPLYQSAVDNTVSEGTQLPSSAYSVAVDGGKTIPADGFKNGYDPAGGTTVRTDVADFDGKTLVVTVDTVKSAVAGTLRVRELQATGMAVNATDKTLPNLRYDLTGGATVNFDANAGAGLKTDVTFNALPAALDAANLGDPSELTHTVPGLTYAAYSSYAGTPTAPAVDCQNTYFFEYGENLPTFVAHAAGDPGSLAAGVTFNELVPGTTAMTAAMKDKTLYATYVDVNHNVVRVALGKITMDSDFTTRLDDTNSGDPEYGDTLRGTPLEGGNPVADPHNYTYQWQYWVPNGGETEKDDAPAGLDKHGHWQNLPNATDRDHIPGKDEVGEYIRVVATGRDDPKTARPSDSVQVKARSLKFDVKPWNKAPDTTSSNIHSYTDDDFMLNDIGNDQGGVYGTDNVTLAPAGTWNNTAAAGTATNVNARPNYRHGDGWTQALGAAVGDKITWPAIAETTGNTVDKVGGYSLGGNVTATSLNGTANVPVYRLRAQDEIPDRGTILSVDVIDENGHEPEYGDKLTADPKKPDGTSDNDPDLTYQWEKWVPGSDGKAPTDPTANGHWEPIPGQTGEDHRPGKDEVDEYIRVVVTDPDDGTKRESAPREIKARSLNFVVERQNRVYIDDSDATNTHTYTVDDFTPTTVKKDAGTVGANNMMAFTPATQIYGGPFGSDVVTLSPLATAGNWNYVSDPKDKTTFHRPDYRGKDDTSIAGTGCASNGEVGSKIIWPQVYENNKDKTGANEWAGQLTDYVLGGDYRVNKGTEAAPKWVEVYRLAPQDEQLDRGEITGGAGGNVMHVNVDFRNYPAIGNPIPNYPDAEDPAADGTGPVAVTDKRETRPGEVRDHNDDNTHTAVGTGYPGKEYIAMWYSTVENASSILAGDFDPTNPGTALNAGNTVASRPTGKYFNAVPANEGLTVVVKVIPRKNFKYELLKDDGSNSKTATKFHFHFSSDVTVDLPVAETGAAGVRKVNEKADGTVVPAGTADSYEVYYMWYTFDSDSIVSPPFENNDDTPSIGIDHSFLYYASTETAAGSQDHHWSVNDKADNEHNTAANSIPGGKKDVDFTFVLDAVKAAVDTQNGAAAAGTGTTLTRTDGTKVKLTAADYGTKWRVVAGAWAGDPNMLPLDDNTSGAYQGKTFKDVVNLPGSANTGDSGAYDGKYAYIEVTIAPGKTLVYGKPLGVLAGGRVTPTPLTVKELEAEKIETTATITKLAYYIGDTFNGANVTNGTVTFNSASMNVSYTAPVAAAADGKGVNSYFEMKKPGAATYDALSSATTLAAADDGKIVYLCYTDVNNHVVRTPLGALKVTKKPDEAPTDQPVTDLMVSYLPPVAGDTPASKPQDWGSKTQVNIANNATTWYSLGTTLPTDGTQWTNTASQQTAAFDRDTWYRVESIITANNATPPYKFDANQKIYINGVEVTVGGTQAEIKDAANNVVGYVKAEWVDSTTKDEIKSMYIAKTVEKTDVTAIAINYVTPVKSHTAAEYDTYLDKEMVTVARYADDTAKGTKWYEVGSATDFTNAAGNAMMTLDTTKYGAGKYYMVENIVEPKEAEYRLSTGTVVYVDGVEVTQDSADTTGSYPGYKTTGNETGLLSIQKTLNAADGTITVRSIYKVPADKPGVINNISITYPEPEKGKEPLPQRNAAWWTYQELSEHVDVSEDPDTATNARKTQGTIWRDAKLSGAPTSAGDFDPAKTPNMAEQTVRFASDTYYMVEGTIEPIDSSYVFDTGDIYVTVNGIVVKVDDTVMPFKAKYQLDDTGVQQEVGWAMAKSVKDADGKVTAILARYIAKTEKDESNVIAEMEGFVTVPVVGQAINAARIADRDARFDNGKNAKDNVTYSPMTWTKSTDAGFTAPTAASGSFESGYYYQAVFTVSANTGYVFQNLTNNFVAFRFNNVDKTGEWGINDKTTPDQETKGGVTVMSKQNGGPNSYTITVRFPLTGEKKDLEVYGYVTAPTAGAVIDPTVITLRPKEADKPYSAKNVAGKEATKWQHWNADVNKWEDTVAGETFQRGEYYRALITAQMKNDPLIRNLYNDFTANTKGFIDNVEVTNTNPPTETDVPSRNSPRTHKVYKIAGDTTVTLVKEFRVPKEQIEVKISSKEPKATENGTYNIDMDVKYYDAHTGYTLSDGVDIVGQWYDENYAPLNDGSGEKGRPFEEGKTYYLIAHATAEKGYSFIDDLSGYHWVEHDLDKRYDELVWDDGDIVGARMVFKYTIPLTPTAKVDIPGFANQPIRDKVLGDIWTNEDFEKLEENTFWSTDEAGNNKVDASTTAEASTTYYATIEVVAKPGVQITGDCFFNGHGIDDANFVTHKIVGQTEDGRDIYRLVYKFPATSSAGGGGGGDFGPGPEPLLVTYLLRNQGVTEDPIAEKVKKNNKPKNVPGVKAMSGLVFKGWSEVDPSTLPEGTLPTLVDPTTFKITEDKIFYAVYERGVDHLHYVIGFPNGTFGPDAKITRAEVATIIARSCLEGFVEGANYGNPGNYNDVSHHWAFSAIAFCAREGVFNGYEDGTFRPDRYITRQELATVVARLAGIQTSKGVPFNDKAQIASWAMNGVYTAFANGWIKGYEDGTFQPERDVNRAETVKIFNGYLKRGVDAKGLEGLKEYIHTGVASNNTQDNHDEYMTWPDVPKTHWAYHEIIEAANDHNYHWQDEEKKTPPEDWDEVYIDKKWKYNDNANDGADKRDENISAQKTFTVTFLVSSNGVTYDAMSMTLDRFSSPDPAEMPTAVPSKGYRFAGWSSTDPSTGTTTLVDPTAKAVTADVWYYAVFEEDKPSALPVYTVTYVIGEHGSYDGATVERVEMFQAPSLEVYPHPVAKKGYRFIGWSETDPANGGYTIMDPTANYITGDKTFYAVYEAV